MTLAGDPLKQMRRPHRSELVTAEDIEPDDVLWAMSAAPFKVTRVTKYEEYVVLRSEASCYGRATNMCLNPDTRLVRML